MSITNMPPSIVQGKAGPAAADRRLVLWRDSLVHWVAGRRGATLSVRNVPGITSGRPRPASTDAHVDAAVELIVVRMAR